MLKLTDGLLDRLCARIPDPPGNPRGGRPRTDKRKALAGIFWLPDNGAKWKDLPREFGSKSGVHRFFQRLVREGVLEGLLQEAGQLVEERGEYRAYECFLDAAFCPARGGGDGIGRTKVGKGVKILIAVDARGLPIAVQSCPARPHESTLAQGVVRFHADERGSGAGGAREGLGEQCAVPGVCRARHGADCAAPEQSSAGESDAGWSVAAAVSSALGGGAYGGLPAGRQTWLRHFRRLGIRWEKSSRAFEAYWQMACAFLLVRMALG